jgi:hypothetical protein
MSRQQSGPDARHIDSRAEVEPREPPQIHDTNADRQRGSRKQVPLATHHQTTVFQHLDRTQRGLFVHPGFHAGHASDVADDQAAFGSLRADKRLHNARRQMKTIDNQRRLQAIVGQLVPDVIGMATDPRMSGVAQVGAESSSCIHRRPNLT